MTINKRLVGGLALVLALSACGSPDPGDTGGEWTNHAYRSYTKVVTLEGDITCVLYLGDGIDCDFPER